MIIEVAIESVELNKIPKDEISALFSELGRASKLGYHRVFLKEDLAKWVMNPKNINLSDIHRQQFGYIMDKIAERGDQVDRAKCKMIIKVGGTEPIKKDGCHWIVSHKKFIDGMTLDQSILLTENSLYDGNLYSMMFNLEADRHGLGPLNSFRFNGGGSGIEEIFADIVEYGKICLAIADLDIYVFNKSVGEKLLCNFREFKDEGIIGLVDLTCGDKIENFLPFAVIRIVYDNLISKQKNTYRDCIKNLETIENIINNNPNIDKSIWLKLDIKKKFIREEFTSVNTDSASNELNNEYKKQKIKVTEGKPDGFSNTNLVKRFLSCSEAVSEFEEFTNSDEWKYLFESWLEPKIWFLCGEDINSG